MEGRFVWGMCRNVRCVIRGVVLWMVVYLIFVFWEFSVVVFLMGFGCVVFVLWVFWVMVFIVRIWMSVFWFLMFVFLLVRCFVVLIFSLVFIVCFVYFDIEGVSLLGLVWRQLRWKSKCVSLKIYVRIRYIIVISMQSVFIWVILVILCISVSVRQVMWVMGLFVGRIWIWMVGLILIWFVLLMLFIIVLRIIVFIC